MKKKLMSIFTAAIMSISLLAQPVWATENISDNTIVNDLYLQNISRAQNEGSGKIVTEQIGNRSFAFISGINGLETWDITDPAAMFKVDTYTDDYVLDAKGYVFDVAGGYLFLHPMTYTNRGVYSYKIENDGKLTYKQKLFFYFANDPTVDVMKDLKAVDDNLLIVTGRGTDAASTNNSSLKIIDISNPESMAIKRGISASRDNTATEISTRAFDAVNVAENTYRICAISRDANGTYFKIQDYNSTDNSIINHYFGTVSDESGLTSNIGNVSSVDFLNKNILLVSYSNKNSTEVIDISNPESPVLKGTSAGTIGDDTVSDVYVMNDSTFVISTKSGALSTYQYKNDTVGRIYPKNVVREDEFNETSPTIPITGIAGNNGYLFVSAANTNAGAVISYNLIPEINLTTEGEISADNPTISGTVKGLADKLASGEAEIILSINGSQNFIEASDVVNGKFNYTLKDFEPNDDIAIKAELYITNTLVSSSEKTVRVNVINSDPTALSKFENVGTLETTANDIYIENDGEKSYAYINTGNGGLKVVDITNPQNMSIVQTIESSEYTIRAVGAGKIFCVKSGDGNNLYVFSKNIDFSNPDETINVGAINGKLKVTDNKYLFVPRKNAVGTYVYDISGEKTEKIMELSAKYHEEGSGIAHNAIDVVSKGNGKYLATVFNREYYDGGHKYDLLTLELDMNNKTYTKLFEGKPSGCPENSMFTKNEDNNYLFKFVNDHTIIRGSNAGGGNARNTDVIDLSNPSVPVWKSAISSGYGRVESAVGVNDDMLVIGSFDPNKIIWKWNGSGYERVNGTDRTVTTEPKAMDKNNGFLFVAETNALNVYKLTTGISIATNEASANKGATVEGTVDGFLAGDAVKVTVDGIEYIAEVSNGRFTANIAREFSEGKKLIKAELIKDGETAASYSKLVSFKNTEYKINSISVSQNGASVENIGELADGKANVTINITNSDVRNYDDAKVFVALYSGGNLVSAKIQSLDLNTGASDDVNAEFDVSASDASSYTIKAFVWSNMKPLGDFKSLTATVNFR